MSGFISETLHEKLSVVSVATLTTCLFKRGLRNTYLSGVLPLSPDMPRLVGEAFTLRYIPAREDLDVLGVFEDRAHPQRVAVESIGRGQVLVVDSRQDTRAASAGGILVARMMKRGAAGVVTDGGLRDTPEIQQLAFPVYCRAPSAPTNLIHHCAIDINVPIGCAGVAVYPNDIVVGDKEGVVVIPRHLAEEIATEACGMTAYEDFVLEEVMRGESLFGLYPSSPESRERFEVWKAHQDEH